MSEAPYHRAAFINAIAEEGTKAEAVEYLQKMWNELCEARSSIRELEADISDERKIAAESGRWLGEIFAVIHGDGGHHLYENGPEISARGAIEVWYAHTAQIDALEAELERRTEAAGARIRELERRASSECQKCRAEMIRLAKGVEGKNSDMELAYLRAADALRTLAGEEE